MMALESFQEGWQKGDGGELRLFYPGVHHGT